MMASVKMKNTTKRLDYTWVVVALCFLMVFVCLGFCSSNKSLYLAPITEALDIKRSTFSLADSFRYITTAVVNLFFGALLGRFGTKKLIGAGFVSLILSTLCYAYANSVWGFYAGSVFLGIGLSWTTTTMVGCVINNWCREKQGTLTGAVLAANGLGSALATQIVSPIIYREGNVFGYRDAYKLIVVILLVSGVLIMALYRERPNSEAVSAGDEGRGNKAKKVVAKADDTKVGNKPTYHKQGRDVAVYENIKKKSYFYLTVLCIFLTGFVLQGVSGVSSAHMKDVGLDAAWIATMVSVNSLALAGSKFLTGALYDRFGLRFVTTVCDIAALVAIFALALISNSASGMVLAVVYAVISAFALPLETVMLPIFAGALFDRRAYNKTLGLFVSINTAGYACSAPVMNWVFDISGSYKSVFMICGLIMIAVLLCFQYVIKVSKQK